jgi:hypothetical protein
MAGNNAILRMCCTGSDRLRGTFSAPWGPMTDDRRDFDEEGGRHRGTSERIISNLFRRTRSTAQQTEDVVRGLLGDLKLPKEVIAYILETVDGTRKEIVRVAAREVREFLESAQVTEEISRMLTTLTFEVRTEIRFIPNDQRLTPRARSEIQLRHRPEGADEEEAVVAETRLGGRDGRISETLEEIVRAGTSELGEFVQRLRRERSSPEGTEGDAVEGGGAASRRSRGTAPRATPPAAVPAPAPATSAPSKSTAPAPAPARAPSSASVREEAVPSKSPPRAESPRAAKPAARGTASEKSPPARKRTTTRRTKKSDPPSE